MKASSITWVLLCLLLLYDHHLAFAASGGVMGGSSFALASSFDSTFYSSYSAFNFLSKTYRTNQTRSPAPMKAPPEVEPIGVHVIMIFFVIVLVFCLCIIYSIDDLHAARTSILKLQVGSLGTGRSLKRDLNRIAESADTSTSKGFNHVLQESIRSLLRHSDYCISGYSSVDVKRSVEECEKRFNQLSFEERGKFDEKSLVNVNNIKKKSVTNQSSNNDHIVVDVKRYLEEYVIRFNQLSFEEMSKSDEETLINVNNIRKKNATSQSCNSEYIVVTIIVAARGVPELPPIKSIAQLKKALQILASIPPTNIMGAQVLWTPQKENDNFTEQEMHEDYPLLHPL